MSFHGGDQGLSAEFSITLKLLNCAARARKVIEDHFQKECRDFAWPFGHCTSEICKKMHKAGFAYGRTTVHEESVLLCNDLMMLHSNCHF